MNKIKLAMLALPLLCAAAFAGQETGHKTAIKVIVADDEASEPTTFEWTSDGSDARLDDMQVGESRAVTDDSGKTVVVTREEDGYNFDVNGRSIKMPELGPHGAHMMMLSADGADFEYDMEFDGERHFVPRRMHHPKGVTIISDEPLDASVQESIRSVLQSAGLDKEVRFVDGKEKHMRVIKKKIEIM